MKRDMKTSINVLLLLGLIVLVPRIAPAADLFLTIPNGPPGSNVKGTLGFQNTGGVIGFSLLLSYSSGSVLSSNASQFTRNPVFFPSVKVGGTEANFCNDIGQGKIRFVGLSPTSGKGAMSIGTLKFAIASKESDTEIPAQVVTLSGQAYIDKGNHQPEAVDLLPVSVTFNAVNTPPRIPSNPTPANNATGISVDTLLSWESGDPDSGSSVVYEVYLGTENPPPLVDKTKDKTQYKPKTRLAYDTTYYWKVIAQDNLGARVPGPLWRFKTFKANDDDDHDGISNKDEIEKYHTDPLKSDTDGDGMPDGWEIKNGLDPKKNDAAKDPDNDGYTNLEECHFGTDPHNVSSKPQPISTLYDVSSNSTTDVAVLWWDQTTKRTNAYVKDSKTGAVVNELSFDTNFKYRALVPVDNNGTCALAVLGVNSDTGDSSVQVKGALTGALVKNMTLDRAYAPMTLAVAPDLNGNSVSEVALLSVRSDTGDVVVQIRDAATGASVNNVTFDKSYTPKALAVIPNIADSGAPGLAVLGIKATTGAVVAQVKNAKTGALVANVSFNKAFTPEAFAIVPNIAAGGVPGLAVLGTHTTTGDVTAQVKNANTGASVANISFDKTYTPRGFAAVPEINSKHETALAVLGVKAATGDVTVQVINAKTGVLVKKVAFSKEIAPKALVILPHINHSQAPRLGVLGVKKSSGEAILQVKDAPYTSSSRDISIP